MSDDEYDTHCPLCVEEMDLSDQNFLPCPCGYKVCMWCWHHIRENLNGLCPACRTPYNSDPHAFSAVDREDVVKMKKEKKQKEKQEKKVGERVISTAPGAKPLGNTVFDRKHLHNYRVVQRNLVYVIGVPANYAFEETLRKPEFFGQYGKIGKVVIHRNPASAHTTVSVYVTFTHREDAKACIQSLDGYWLDQTHLLRASFGTTKYCNNFIRGVPCNNPDCVYLHDLGDDDDRFTKEEIQAGHSKIAPVPGKDQTLVTGNGGPSGTGKRPTGEPVLPPPVFIQDNNGPSLNATTPTAAQAAAAAAGAGVAGGAAAVGAPPGVSAGAGGVRPAAVSRSGTGTWGTVPVSAFFGGGDNSSSTTSSSAAAAVTSAPAAATTPAPGLTTGSEKRGGVAEDPTPAQASAAAAGPTAAPTASAPSGPTAVLKRSGSNSTAATPAPAPASTTTPAPTPAASTTAAPAAAPEPTPATVPAAKVKPKTAKEIAAEKKAALAAAKAAAATTAATDATTPEVESKPVGPAPTPKLTARQQMLQAKAEKAAARAAEKAERAAEKSAAQAAAQEKANAAASASAATATTDSSTDAAAPATTGTTAKVSAIIKRPDKTKATAASPVPLATPSSASTASTEAVEPPPMSLPSTTTAATPAAVTGTAPINIATGPTSTLLWWNETPTALSRFNGLSANAVFPVPVSSLSCSVWSNILRASNEDLSMNPYGQLTTPLCELLDLTLPPGDALQSAAPVWPRPISYYTAGMTNDGITSTPAGKHNHARSVVDMATLPALPPLPPPSLQPRADAVFQPGTASSKPIALAPGSTVGTAPAAPPAATSVPASAPAATSAAPVGSKGAAGPAAARQEGSIDRMARDARERAIAAGLPPPGPPGPAGGGGASMNALRQLFPGVKLSVSHAAPASK